LSGSTTAKLFLWFPNTTFDELKAYIKQKLADDKTKLVVQQHWRMMALRITAPPAKVAIPYSVDSFVVNQTLVLRIDICGKNRYLCRVAKRCASLQKQTDNDEHTNFNSEHFDTFGFLHPYIYGGQRAEINKTKLRL